MSAPNRAEVIPQKPTIAPAYKFQIPLLSHFRSPGNDHPPKHLSPLCFLFLFHSYTILKSNTNIRSTITYTKHALTQTFLSYFYSNSYVPSLLEHQYNILPLYHFFIISLYYFSYQNGHQQKKTLSILKVSRPVRRKRRMLGILFTQRSE
jgi:hypothetical protein